MNILAVEPYYGGSHQAFLDSVMEHSRHRWSLLSLPARHWKWRMRHAPLSLAIQTNELIQSLGHEAPAFDAVLASEMLDLPAWRGFGASFAASNDAKASVQRWWELPTVIYFHENQWTYPVPPRARPDAHYGYTNLLTAIAADEVWFNSHFHQREFMDACEAFVRRMPDANHDHDFERIKQHAHVVSPGFRQVGTRDDHSHRQRNPKQALRLGWVSRWEDDKRPDQFLHLLEKLRGHGLEFELILLGSHRQPKHAALTSIEERFPDRILFNAMAETRASFEHWLRQMDVVVSTADHEFFGIAVCEAISAGAIPLLPNRLCYPEWIPLRFLYANLDEAAQRLLAWAQNADWEANWASCQNAIAPFQIERVAQFIDQRIESLPKSTNRNDCTST